MEENTNEKKKQKVVILIGLVTLLIAVLGATYAYFQISTNTESSNTNITGKTPPKSLVTLTQGTSNLHLNISASDMSLASANNEYYATDGEEKAYEENEENGTKTIASVELTGGEATTKYSCTAKLTVSKVTEPLDEADTMIEVLQPGDMILQFKGNIISEQLDLSELKENNPKEYNLSFKVTGNKVESIQAYIKLLNKNEPQNYLSGKKLNIDINTSDLNCNVYIQEPTIVTLRKNDTQKYLSEDTQGDMYRYQASFPDSDSSEMTNWICFGTTENCSSSEDNIDKYMYRIIGITDEGQLYLLKETFLKEKDKTDFAWHSVSNNSSCQGENCEWSNVALYKRLNGTSNGSTNGSGKYGDGDTNIFLGTNEHPSSYEYLTQGTDWYNLIEEHKWMYGDTSEHLYDGNEMYAIEHGDKETKHYVGTGDNITQEPYTWSKSVDAKIGLMYIHDIDYAYPGGNPGNGTNVTNSWIYSGREWLITRWGFSSGDDGNCHSYYTNYTGYFRNDDISYKVMGTRPTFYLSSNAKIASGDGTKTNPYILDVQV